MCAKLVKAKVVGHNKPKGPASPHWKGYGEISAAYWRRYLLTNASKRKRQVTITKEYMWELFLAQNRSCALTGWALMFSSNFGEQTASIDRIDSTKDYVPENVRWVHKDVNRARQEFTDQYFIKLCSAVACAVQQPEE